MGNGEKASEEFRVVFFGLCGNVDKGEIKWNL